MLRMVLEDYESSYEELLSKCGMSMLEIQRATTLAIEVNKSIHQMTPNLHTRNFQYYNHPI